MGKQARQFIDRLHETSRLSEGEYVQLLREADESDRAYACELANRVRQERFGNQVFVRGLVEFSNFCRNNCLYCGIRRDNRDVSRYRLTDEQVLGCLEDGYGAGFRTLVLQGGEDPGFPLERMIGLVGKIKSRHRDCAVTLSIGELSREAYERLYAAGAERYLLRHESATASHYAQLHPADQVLATRMRCLYDLRDIGYQVGCGFMVGAPYQTLEHRAKDLHFIQEFRPHMVGLGPFIPHHATPFRDFPSGTIEETLLMLALVRLAIPDVLLPATTALATLKGKGRLRGILSGANVIMPNLSPCDCREKYMLYDDKANTGAEAAEGLELLRRELREIDCVIPVSRGDSPRI